jgi:hypothetical protein
VRNIVVDEDNEDNGSVSEDDDKGKKPDSDATYNMAAAFFRWKIGIL